MATPQEIDNQYDGFNRIERELDTGHVWIGEDFGASETTILEPGTTTEIFTNLPDGVKPPLDPDLLKIALFAGGVGYSVRSRYAQIGCHIEGLQVSQMADGTIGAYVLI